MAGAQGSESLVIIRQVFEELGGRDALFRQQKTEAGILSDQGEIAATEIMLHCIPVFLGKGIEPVTVNDLIQAAGVSRRTFYKYYPSKMAVLETVYRAGVDLMMGQLQTMAAESSSLRELVERSVGLFFDCHRYIGPLLKLLEEEAMRSESPLAVYRQQGYDAMVELFHNKMLGLELEAPDRMVFYTLIWAMEAASLNLLKDTRHTREDVNRVREVVIRIVMNSLQPAGY